MIYDRRELFNPCLSLVHVLCILCRFLYPNAWWRMEYMQQMSYPLHLLYSIHERPPLLPMQRVPLQAFPYAVQPQLTTPRITWVATGVMVEPPILQTKFKVSPASTGWLYIGPLPSTETSEDGTEARAAKGLHHLV